GWQPCPYVGRSRVLEMTESGIREVFATSLGAWEHRSRQNGPHRRSQPVGPDPAGPTRVDRISGKILRSPKSFLSRAARDLQRGDPAFRGGPPPRFENLRHSVRSADEKMGLRGVGV